MGLQRVLAAIVLTIAATAVAATSRLDLIDLPTGFFPEGITLAEEWTVYVGSFNEDGAIWKGDLRTGEGEVVIKCGQSAGLDYDKRSGYLFVSGAFAGTIRIYDTADYSLVKEFTPADTDDPPGVNDVIVTKEAAYFTDSFHPQLLKVPLDRRTGKLRDGAHTEVVAIPLSSGFPNIEGNFNSNGIEVTDDGKTLLVVNSAVGELYKVDPESGEASLVDLGGVSVYGDGMVLRQNTLWIVESTSAAGDHTQIIEVSLSPDLSCGSVLPRVQVNEYFDFPSTTVRKGNSFYTVMMKLGVPAEDIPTTSFEIVRTDRDSGMYECPAH